MISIMDDATTGTSPFSFFYTKGLVDMTTIKTSFAGRIEAINQMYNLALGGSDITQYAHEFRSSKVAHFAPPQSLHPLHVKVFKEQLIVLVGQFVRQLKEEVSALVDHRLIDARYNGFGFLPTTGKLDLAGKILLSNLQFCHCPTIVQWAFNLIAIRCDQECFEAKIKTCTVTRHGLIVLTCFFLGDKEQIKIAKTVTFDRDGLDVRWNIPALAELIDRALNLDSVFAKQLPTCLFEGEAAVLLDLLESGWTSANLALEVAKEQLIRLVDSLYYILDRLTTYKTPMCVLCQSLELSYMPLQSIQIQTLSSQFVVAAMQGNAMVIDRPGNVDLLMQQSILFLPVQFELVCPDDHTFLILLSPRDQSNRSTFCHSTHRQVSTCVALIALCAIAYIVYPYALLYSKVGNMSNPEAIITLLIFDPNLPSICPIITVLLTVYEIT